MSVAVRPLWTLLAPLGLLVLLAAMPAVGETFYKWVDKDGVTHYSKEKPSDRASEETLVVRSQGQAPLPVAPDPVPPGAQPLQEDGTPAPPSKAEQDYAKARQKAAACTWATGGLMIAERFLQASLGEDESAGVQDTAKYRQEADEMRQLMNQNCVSAPQS